MSIKASLSVTYVIGIIKPFYQVTKLPYETLNQFFSYAYAHIYVWYPFSYPKLATLRKYRYRKRLLNSKKTRVVTFRALRFYAGALDLGP